MLNDHWTIALLIAQVCSCFLLLKAGWSSIRQIRFWNAESRSSLQLGLERETYLIGSIAQLSLGFQLIGLILFVANVNLHLPGMLKGAMCATGVLGINPLGYPLLALKSLSVLLYAVFLSLNFLDEREPGFVLTPKKYYWIFPSVLLLIADLSLSIAYFSQISPDIITTCCSVSFGKQAGNGFFGEGIYGQTPWALLLGFYSSGLAAVFLWKRFSKAWAIFLSSAVFIVFGILSLKGFFVKYIYGLPSHACLFDIFWGKYYYIGYAIFGSYYTMAFSSISYWVTVSCKSALQMDTQKLEQQLRWVGIGATAMVMLIPTLYYLAWGGSL